jgi:branched-chain amino acid transport system ATP-binding protein
MTVEENLKMGGFIAAARPKYRQRLDFVYELFSAPARATPSARRQHVGGRAADVRDRPRPHVRARGCSARRASAGLSPGIVEMVFDRVKRIRAIGVTVLIVEQNVQQVLRWSIAPTCIRRQHPGQRLAAELLASDSIREAYLGV